jgi:hypothetical protein
VDILHYPVDRLDSSRYSLILLLGKYGDIDELDKLWGNDPPEDGDAFQVETISKSPLIIGVSGVDCRGTMYAAYKLAELIEMNTDLTDLDIQRMPKIKKRYAWTDFTSYGWTSKYRPTLFPRYGVNGVLISLRMRGGSVHGYLRYPFFSSEDGEILPCHPEIDEWKQIIKKVKEFGFEIAFWYRCIVPPSYDRKDIESYYKGEIELRVYDDDLRVYNKN